MAKVNPSLLQNIDLNKLSIIDVMNMKQGPVRDKLIEIITNQGSLVGKEKEHTSHGMHTNHLKDASQFVPRELIESLDKMKANLEKK